MIWECLKTPNELNKESFITLLRSIEHNGVEDNEVEEKLPRRGAKIPFIGPNSLCGNSKHILLKEMEKKWVIGNANSGRTYKE